VKGRGKESDGQVSRGADMFDVSKPRETGVTSKRIVGHDDVSGTLQQVLVELSAP
jgi:hypothetical protein